MLLKEDHPWYNHLFFNHFFFQPFSNLFPIFISLCKYSRSDITEQIIKNCRGVKKSNDSVNRLDKEKQRENFRQLFGFKENEVFESKEYSITKKIKNIFKKHKIIDKYRVEKYFIDLFFTVHKLGIEIDENGHTDKTETKEQEREKIIKEAGITLIRINLDKKDF